MNCHFELLQKYAPERAAANAAPTVASFSATREPMIVVGEHARPVRERRGDLELLRDGSEAMELSSVRSEVAKGIWDGFNAEMETSRGSDTVRIDTRTYTALIADHTCLSTPNCSGHYNPQAYTNHR